RANDYIEQHGGRVACRYIRKVGKSTAAAERTPWGQFIRVRCRTHANAFGYTTDSTSNMMIKTDRLILREFVPEDWRAVYSYQNDPRYLEFNEWEHRTEQEGKPCVQPFVDQQQ